MKELASYSLCFVCFDSYQVQNLVQAIEMIQYNKQEIIKIKDRNQPILHIFKNIENELPKSIQSFYKYVHKGYFSKMLTRSFRYKPRNKKETVKTITKDNIIKKGRRMIDFEDYINKNLKANIVEMDNVIGKFEDTNVS